MSIPPFNEDGILPPGIYPCSLLELQERFGRFQGSDRRFQLFERLTRLFKLLTSTGMVLWVVIDGSFVTTEDSPNDIDLVLVVRSDHDFAITLRPFEYNALSKRWIRKEFGFDAVVAREGSRVLIEYLEFFAQVRKRPELTKGLLRIDL